MTRVSVCMATYNGAPYLREQLDSILSQLHPEDELIVSDDNSTDGTRSIIASYDDPRIRLIVNPGQRGHVQNFAHAMTHASGQFIALSDQDDIWVDNRLEKMLDQLRPMPPCSLVVGDFVEFGNAGSGGCQSQLGSSPRYRLVQLYRIFLGQTKYFGSAYLFRRELIRFVLPIPKHIEAHDVWIAMNACTHGKISHLQMTTLMRRLHGNNLTPARHRGLWPVFRSRAFYLLGLLQSSTR